MVGPSQENEVRVDTIRSSTIFWSVIIFIFSLKLDNWAYTMVPVPAVTYVANIFSFMGEGLLLITVALILLLGGIATSNDRLKRSGRDGLITIAVVGIAVQLLKAAFERPRMRHRDGAITELLQDPSIFDATGRFNSFPSGHTSVSFALAFTLSAHFPALRPFLLTLAALVGFGRVYLGSHYPSDVVAGAVTGVLASYFVLKHLKDKMRWLTWGLFFTALCLTFFKLGSLLLFDVDEAVFSEATREMLETGDFISPTYNYEPRYDKPILFYWLMSLSYSLFGITEFGARFVSALLGLGLIGTTYQFVRYLKGRRTALISSLILLLNLEFFIYSHSAVTDMTLCFFITSSLYSFFLAESTGDNRWLYLSSISAALAVLTKGIIGLLFPGAIALIYLVAAGRAGYILTILRPRYLLLFFGVAAPWFIAEYAIKGAEFYEEFIVKHHFKRYTDVVSSHSGPIYYYVIHLLIAFFPWVVFLPAGLIAAFKGVRWGSLSTASEKLPLFCFIWFLFVFIFFSISGTKLPNYIFPLFPGAAILVGIYLSALIWKEKDEGVLGSGEEEREGRNDNGSRERVLPFPKAPHYLLLILSATLAALLFGVNFLPPSILGGGTVEGAIDIPTWLPPLLALIFASFGAVAYGAIRSGRVPLLRLASITLLLLVVLRTYGLPQASLILQEPLYTFSTYSREFLQRTGEHHILTTYEINKPSVPFYARNIAVKFDRSNIDSIKVLSGYNVVMITAADRVAEVKGKYGLKVIEVRGGYAMLESRPEIDWKNWKGFNMVPANEHREGNTR